MLWHHWNFKIYFTKFEKLVA